MKKLIISLLIITASNLLASGQSAVEQEIKTVSLHKTLQPIDNPPTKDFYFRRDRKVNIIPHFNINFPKQIAIAKSDLKHKDQVTSKANRQATANDLTIVSEYDNGNAQYGINDDNIAVSASGWKLSHINGTISIYDQNGQQALQSPTIDFTGISPADQAYDGRVIYDELNDRFILVFINFYEGNSTYYTELCVGFSTQEDPTQNWNVYILETIDSPVGFDFPQISLSQSELIIAIQKLGTQSVYQVGLNEGYNGDNLNFVEHSVGLIGGNRLNIGTVRQITQNNDKAWFIASDKPDESVASNNIYFYELTNTIANNGTLEGPLTLHTNIDYIGTPGIVDIGDASISLFKIRVLGAYIFNDKIEFVMNTISDENTIATMHATINMQNGTPNTDVDASIIQFENAHVIYPAIAYGGCTGGTSGINSSVVSGIYATTALDSKVSCIASYIDTLGQHGNFVFIKEGLAINTTNPNESLRPDYTDVKEVPGSPGYLFVQGFFTNNNAGYPKTGSWIAEVLAPCGTPVSVNEIAMLDNMKVYPNPASEYVLFDIEIAESGNYTIVLTDISGKRVMKQEKSFSEGSYKGRMKLDHLTSGIYILNVVHDNVIISTNKLMVH